MSAKVNLGWTASWQMLPICHKVSFFLEIVKVGLTLFVSIITIPPRKSSEGPQLRLHHPQYSNLSERNMHAHKFPSPGSLLHLS